MLRLSILFQVSKMAKSKIIGGIMKLKQIKLAMSTIALTAALSACAQFSAKDKAYEFNAENRTKLNAVVDARDDKVKGRDGWRKPAETLEFFRVEPGMTVVEALPGGGWYTEIIANYLGSDATIYGLHYNDDMWSKFGFFSEEAIKMRIADTARFPEIVAEKTTNGIKAKGYTFDGIPASLNGTVDRVLLIRAFHNLNRFEDNGGYRSQALKTMHDLLKTGGMVGIVQHSVAETADDEGAKGQRGYLKQSAVIKMFQDAGFKLVAKSNMHANPKDMPGPKDIVWRLPPTLLGAKDKPEQAKAMNAIGESNRMTLLFEKI